MIRNTRGASLVEYALLTGLIAVASIYAVSRLGVATEFELLVDALEIHEITQPLGNYLVNGDFDDVSGMTSQSWGYSGANVEGWTSLNGLPFEFHSSGWQGMTSVSGDYWLDTNASPGGLDIEQHVTGLIHGAVYRLTLQAGDRDPDLDGEALVFWNGELVGSIDPDVEDRMVQFDFHIRAGHGDGTDRIRITDIGANDSNGLSLDEVRIWGR